MNKEEFYDYFKSNLLPRNYAITKSMEISKINTSGTLWYTKKFIVLYNYIFLDGDKIETNEYVNKCIDSFDSFICSLDDSVKEEAKDFFYPKNNKINFKSSDFVTFSSFIEHRNYASVSEKFDEMLAAKKYYFAYLMQSGGQSGVKKYIKDRINEDGFRFSIDNIKNVIREFSNNYSEEEINGYFNDYHAFLRNERQILFYYGFFHNKSGGARDIEFSSLTPIGELALISNYDEFLSLWEMQKLKMISQTVSADINKISDIDFDRLNLNCDSFGVSYSPYMDILKYLKKYNSVSYDTYQFIISRNKELYLDGLFEYSDYLIEQLNDVKNTISEFGTTDNNVEDPQKELKKYMLGLRSDLSLDNGKNYFGCVEITNSSVSITNIDVFNKIYDSYEMITAYKKYKYSNLFEDNDIELSRQYLCKKELSEYERNRKKKIDWDLYNIQYDQNILLFIMLTQLSIKYNVEIRKENITNLSLYLTNDFNILLKRIGYTNLVEVKNKIKKLINSFRMYSYDNLDDVDNEGSFDINSREYRDTSTADLENKILETSIEDNEYIDGVRKRKSSLIKQIKALYMFKYADVNTGMLKCECCKEDTFITYANEPYLEFHHLIPFGKEGPDHYYNLFALCPNCHRKIHLLGVDNKQEYYRKLNKNNYLKLTYIDRLVELKNENVLKSYQLEYLLAENAITDQEYERIIA